MELVGSIAVRLVLSELFHGLHAFHLRELPSLYMTRPQPVWGACQPSQEGLAGRSR